MCESVVPVKVESFSGMAAKSSIGQCAKAVLRHASSEKRLTVGLLPAIQYLSKNCNDALFCFTSAAPSGDSATHMQEVLLQAFCVENDIYVIKVDSSQKMRQIIGVPSNTSDLGCVLVHFPYTDPFSDNPELDLTLLSDSDRDLMDHCEENWRYNETPVIKLPEK